MIVDTSDLGSKQLSCPSFPTIHGNRNRFVCNRPIAGPLLHRLLTNPIINGFDVTLLFLFLLFLIIEMVADQQQWDFHQRKKVVVTTDEGKRLAKGGRGRRPFWIEMFFFHEQLM